jgi:hypothetical protein
MGKQNDGNSMKYYKSQISGLAISVSDPDPDDRRTVGVDEVQFKPVQFFDEKRGERYSLGFLATDDDIVQQLLEEDSNVVEIKKDEYDKAFPVETE